MEKADFSVDIDDEFHGFDGPVYVNVPEDTPVFTKELLNAFIELGKTEGDYNGEDLFVVSRLQSLDYNTATADIKPNKSGGTRISMFFRTNSTFYNDTLLDYLDLWYHNKRPLIPGSATQIILLTTVIIIVAAAVVYAIRAYKQR
ncbi:hypothetical protein HUJ05_010616 [Dendroctonus ponderosae]|nr:hypothetical protein HUJ05_010616 [Dendroctonus ponderosae]